MKLFTSLLLLTSPIMMSAEHVLGEEHLTHSSVSDHKSLVKQKSQYFLYGSLSLAPGIGCSQRARYSTTIGTAIDYKIGVIPLSKTAWLPIPMVDYNFMYFFESAEKIYISGGVGLAYTIPYVPLRFGLQHHDTFIDVGVKMILGYVPAPELRLGFKLNF